MSKKNSENKKPVVVKSKPKKAKAVEKEVEVEVSEAPIGEKIKFQELFRVKGKEGLFLLRSEVNKAGLCNVLSFKDFQTNFTVRAESMICLGQLIFTTYSGHADIGLNVVFNNLEAHIKAAKNFDFEKCDREKLLPVLVPEYGEDKFKKYHVEWVLMWYKLITNKYTELEQYEKLENAEKDKN